MRFGFLRVVDRLPIWCLREGVVIASHFGDRAQEYQRTTASVKAYQIADLPPLRWLCAGAPAHNRSGDCTQECRLTTASVTACSE